MQYCARYNQNKNIYYLTSITASVIIRLFYANFWHFQKQQFNVQTSTAQSNIPCKFKCYISKSKLVLSKCNDLYFIAIAFIAFTLHEIKQSPGFQFWEGGGGGRPV